MSTSGRYRFPTVDCDDELRDEMKRGEAGMRDQELKITEQLFFPKSQDSGKKKKKQGAESYAPKGARVSARQQAKRGRLLERSVYRPQRQQALQAACVPFFGGAATAASSMGPE